MSQVVQSEDSSVTVVDSSRSSEQTEKTDSKQSASAEETQTDETTENSEDSEKAEGEAEQSGELEAKEDEDGGDEPAEKPKKKTGFQKRIEKLNRSVSERDAEIVNLRAELEKSRATGGEKKAAQNPEALPTQPNENDFNTNAEYEAAMAEWRIDVALAKRDAAAKEEKAKADSEAAMKASVESFEARRQESIQKSAAFAEKHPDFKDVVASVDDIALSPTVSLAILDNGPEFIYELAKNRAELERINALDVRSAERAIGRIEERLASRKAKAETKPIQSKAPTPIAPVGSKGSSQSKSIEDMDPDEYMAHRRKEQTASR